MPYQVEQIENWKCRGLTCNRSVQCTATAIGDSFLRDHEQAIENSSRLCSTERTMVQLVNAHPAEFLFRESRESDLVQKLHQDERRPALTNVAWVGNEEVGTDSRDLTDCCCIL